MVRCVVYTSKLREPVTEGALQTLALMGGSRNAALGVTSRLLVMAEHFVHGIEGDPTAVDAVLGRVSADPRHHALVVALDRPMTGRYFAGSRMDVLTQRDLSDADRARLADAIALARSGGDDLAPDGWRLLEPLAGIRPDTTYEVLRTRPTQTRSQVTVDRLLDVARRLITIKGAQGLTVEGVADASGVSYQTAYRYFAAPSDLLRTLVRQTQVRQFHHFRVSIRHMRFTSTAEMARFVARYCTRGYGSDRAIPHAIMAHVLRHHHEIWYDGLRMLAADLLAAMHHSGLDTSDPDLEAKLAAALAGIAGALKMGFLQDSQAVGSPGIRTLAFEAVLAGIMIGALESRPPMTIDRRAPIPAVALPG
jgi:AcrR family transcriptional regulator